MDYINTKYLFKCDTCHCMRSGKCTTFCDSGECYSPDLSKIPTADVVEIDTLKHWLLEIAINNVGCILDGDFSDACVEIISRLGGLRNLVKETRERDNGDKQQTERQQI